MSSLPGGSTTLPKAILWALAAIACFHLAYEIDWLRGLIVVFLFSLVPLAHLETNRKAFYLGLVVGFGIYAPQLVFFWTIFNAAAIALWSVLAFWVALFLLLSRQALVRYRRMGLILIPVLWLGLEFFRSELYYLRFSWLTPGLVFSGTEVAKFLGILGVYGIGFLLFGIAVTAWSLPLKPKALVLALAVLGTSFLGRPVQPAASDDNSLVRVAGVQMEFPDEDQVLSALNDTAGEPIARAHHGSVAREQRMQIEDDLKSGRLPCIVATSSLELGLDLGAVDLVVQIEAPPSVSSGIQRIGRSNHHVGGDPRGTIFPKHRGDLVAAAEAVRRMRSGEIEPTRHLRNPLDVLAQQIAAIVSSEDSITVDALHALVRRAAPFAELTRGSLEGVLDMLSGRYPSDEFAELRPRITWDRESGALTARRGTKRLAIVNAGVIPDRGLYGVFLADGGSEKVSKRVGELDEEMVFEAREGEIFVLGASSWRITEITHDRVMVVPAPGQPGKMPFWHGDRVGRSVELGRGIGALVRSVDKSTDEDATERLVRDHSLDPRAAANLVRYVREQAEEPFVVPTDRTLVVERFVDEVGDHRVCLLSPFGSRVHAPLAACIVAKAREELGLVAETVYTDDGIVLRFPESR